jgi:ABC-type Zn2+ transport system substrate-binding protein/surface adhesin
VKTTLLLLAAALTTQSLTPLVTSSHAGPNHDHDHAHTHGDKADIPIPETRADLWTAIKTEHAALVQAVENRTDEAVHQAEGKLQAYLKSFPEKVADLEESARKRIEGQTRNLARAYDAVHHAVDDKAWDKAASEMKKAEGGIKLLTAQMSK